MAYRCVNGNHECDGCGRCKKEKSYYCPICGEEVYETVFVSNDGEVIGCENCAQIKEPCDMIKDNDDDEYERWRDKELETEHL
jgi:hypothetical protein